MVDADDALAECVGGHLDLAGPVTVERLVDEAVLPSGAVRGAPVDRGQGTFRPGPPRGRRFGHRAPRRPLVRPSPAGAHPRRQPVPSPPAGRGRFRVASYVRFLASWQHLAPGTGAEGRAGLLAVIEQLQGIEAPAGEWERHLLPSRVAGYDPRWLDELCLAGQVAWGRLHPAARRRGRGRRTPPTRGTATPSPATPLALVCREDLGWTWPRSGPGRGGGGAVGRGVGRSARRAGGPGAPPSAPSSPGSPDGSAATSTRACGIWSPGASSRPTPSPPCGDCWPPTPRRPGPRPGPGPARRPRPGPHASRQRHRRGTLVAPARAGGPGRGDRSGVRGAGRGRGLAAAGPLGRRGLGALGARVLPDPLARRGAGPAAARGPGPGHGWTVRRRHLR